MNGKLLHFSIISIFVLFSGCVGYEITDQIPLKEDDNILVVSNLSLSVSLDTIGTTVFTNSYKNFELDEWAPDQAVEELTVSIFRRMHNYRFSSPTEKETKELIEALIHSQNDYKSASKAISNLAVKNKAARIVLITPLISHDKIYFTNHKIRGLGILQRSILGIERAAIHASFGVLVFDGRSGNKMYEKSVLKHANAPIGWKESNAEISESDQVYLKQWFLDSITGEIGPMLEWTRLDWYDYAPSMPYKEKDVRGE